ncbi:MAG: hypothetical protein COB38_09250 [Gammaproteobacteria bacterium]|nr:MAG: hypothetical protein COB38_09250 [Gammaproteobacteria bacterium]
MKYIYTIFLLCILLLGKNVSANEWLIGVGEIYQADESGYEMYSLSFERNDWKGNVSYWETYPYTAWLETNPEWGIDYVESHYMVAIIKTLFDYQASTNLSFYFDLGLTYTSRLSKANSSSLNFQENLGLAYKNMRLYLRHTSNANIKGSNRGEDALVFEIGFKF